MSAHSPGGAASSRSMPESMREFSRNPMRAGRELGDAFHANRGVFVRSLLRETDLDVTHRGFRYSIALLMNNDALIPIIASLTATTFSEAVRLTRSALQLDPNFINLLVGGLAMRADLKDTEHILRVLEIIGECPESLANWRSLARLQNDDPKVQRKCAALLARFRFSDRAGLERFRSCNSRVRANIVQTLWDENQAKATALLDVAFDDYDNRVVGNACLALYQAGDARSLARLAQMLASPEPRDQITAAWVAGRCRDGRLARHLERAAQSAVSEVARMANESLGQLNPIPDLDAQVPSGPEEDILPMHVASPVAPTPAGETELWLRVKGPQGEFVRGIRPVDFFVWVGAETIPDYSVIESGSEGLVSAYIVYPAWAGSLTTAIKTSLPAKPPKQSWAICTYLNPVGSASPGGGGADKSPQPESDAALLATLIEAGPQTAAGVEEAVRRVLGTGETNAESHLFLVLDRANTPANTEALRCLCAEKNTTLHGVQLRGGGDSDPAFPALVRDETEISLLWPEWMASLERRYVLSSKQTATGIAIRSAQIKPERFSRRISLLDGAKA